jgi:phosphoglycerate kinase
MPPNHDPRHVTGEADTVASFALCRCRARTATDRVGALPVFGLDICHAGTIPPISGQSEVEVTMPFRTLDNLEVAGKRVLLRADLNVPVRDGKITDLTRIERLSPTIRELAGKGAKVIVCSHFDRPRGKRVPEMSLAPMAVALGEVLGQRVRFAEDCIGVVAQQAVERMARGDVLVLENTRYDAAEEKNDPAFAAELAKLADIYVNDAFSAAHRAHASTEGVAHLLPAYAGRLMQAELEALDAALGNPVRPVAAIVGGAKVSTKLELLGNLLSKVDVLVIGGAMANTFLAAQGVAVGRSLQEAELHDTARGILAQARTGSCEIVLPLDAVVATELKANVPTQTVGIDDVPADAMILDLGPATVADLTGRLGKLRTLVWNGPLGAFETPPFDAATTAFARAVAEATRSGALRSVAGGGDTVSALRHAGVLDQMSYVSTAGGAFLEWLEGKTLPGVAAL